MSIGIWQVVLVLMIVLILFGAGKLPRVMGDLAKGVKNFKSGLKDEDEEAEETKAIPGEKGEKPADVSMNTAAEPRVAKDEAAKSS